MNRFPLRVLRSLAPRSPERTAALLALVASLPLWAGCFGGGIYPVEGQVTWKNGAPAKELAGSLIFFEQAEKMTSSQGLIQSDGSFRLKTLEDDDGAPDGEHVVYIIEV